METNRAIVCRRITIDQTTARSAPFTSRFGVSSRHDPASTTVPCAHAHPRLGLADPSRFATSLGVAYRKLIVWISVEQIRD